MCGIWGYIALTNIHEIEKLFTAFMTVQKRGPDRSDFKIISESLNIYLGFHRLSIMDKSTNGDQPFTGGTKNRSIYSITNGEIYNFKQLIKDNNFDNNLKSGSDCEFLPMMYQKYGFKNMIEQLRGEFATCILDIDHSTNNIKLYIGRDQLAVRPVFIGIDENGIAFSSILKGLVGIVDPKKITQLKRAEFVEIDIKNKDVSINSYIYHILDKKYINTNFELNDTLLLSIRDTFTGAVKCRLDSDRPLGALLSGGLDSSLVVSIASNELRKNNKKLRTFSVGIPGSTDKDYALLVSKFCDTIHTHIEFSEQDFLDAIDEVILATETYDTTTVRASVGQYLISKWIKENTDIRVLLIGDGSDELTAGYMYFHKAPNSEESHTENIRLLEDIEFFDVLRADRCIAYNGIEARVPFLDHIFVDLYLSIPYDFRIPKQEFENGRKIEKWLLRKSFDRNNDNGKPYLPVEVLWRKKEAFSDGVSSTKKSWYQIIQDNVENIYSDDDFKKPEVSYHLIPKTKESLHFRLIFNKYFHYESATVIPYYWLPKWCGNIIDPSARVLQIYDN